MGSDIKNSERKKVRRTISKGIFLSFLYAASFSIFSCANFNTPVKEFFERYTDTAAIEIKQMNDSYEIDASGMMCYGSDSDKSIDLYLRNPQMYDISFGYSYDLKGLSSVLPASSVPFTIVQNPRDKARATLTFKKDFLEAVDIGSFTVDSIIKKNISGNITLVEKETRRPFDSFHIELRADSVPPSIERATFQMDKDPSKPDSQYVVCFFMPCFENGSVHNKDTKTIFVNGRPFYFDPATAEALYRDSSLSEQELSFDKKKPSLVPIVQAGSTISFDETIIPVELSGVKYKPLYYKTGIRPSNQEVRFTFSIVDDSGLSSSTIISNKAKKLRPPVLENGTVFTAEEDSGYYSFKITHNGQTTDDSSAGFVYINSVVANASDSLDITKDSQYGTSVLKLKPGNYNIEAYASKNNFVSSAPASVSGIRVRRPAIYYVRANGNDTEGLGSKQKPFATIQKAIREINNNKDIDVDTKVYIRLMSNIQVSDTIEFSGTTLKNITVEPYGIGNAKISLGGVARKILIDAQLQAAGAKLTLNNITLENGCTEAAPSTSSLIYSDDDNSLIMNNVTIQNSAVQSSACIVGNSGPAEMNNCTVKKCYGENNLIYGSSLTIKNCSITGNKAKCIVYNNGNMKLIDSAVSDNTIINGDSDIGAILTMAKKTTTLGGKVIIKNNKTSEGVQRNFTYNDDSNSKTIQIDSPLTGSDIHISYVGTTPPGYGKSLTFTSGYSTNLKANPGTIFTSDDGFVIGWNDIKTEAALYSSAVRPGIQMVGDIKSLKEQLEKRINDSKYTMGSSTFEALSSDISDNTLFNIKSLNVSIDGGDKDRRGKIDLKSVQGRAFTISGNCNVEISNIDFTSDHDGNTYNPAYYGKYHGTGILVKSGAVVTIENCTFEKLSVDINRWKDSGNTGFAGIIEVEDGGKVIIKNCIIKNSRLLSNGSWGGAVCIQEGGKAEISDTTIEGIRGGHAGGALMVLGECTMKNCTISSNTSGDGAGIYLYNDDKSTYKAHLLAKNCTIQSNDARESRDTRDNQGGAGYIECNGTAEFIDCEITDNLSIKEGKAFYVLRGTLKLDEKSRKNISSSHNIFVKSSATYNGTTYDKDTTITSP